MRWHEFTEAEPAMAEVGLSLLYRENQGEVAILATVDERGRPRVAPVSPIFCEGGLYLSVGAHTPKARHLQHNGLYALHALVGADDLEFQISGSVREIDNGAEHERVVAAIPFPSFDASDPIFELLLERALTVTWTKPATRGSKSAWVANPKL